MKNGFRNCCILMVILLYSCASAIKIPNTYSAAEWTDKPGRSKDIAGTFKGLTGYKTLDINFREEGTYLVNYRFEKSSGYLVTEMRTDTQSVLKKTINEVLQDSVFLAYGKGQRYHLVIGGVNAYGKFNLTYTLRK